MDGPQTIEAHVGADPRMARVARVTAMNVATSAGLSLDRVEDLGLAVTEAFGAVAGHDAPVQVLLEVGDGSVTVAISSSAPKPLADLDVLSRTILDHTTEELQIDSDARSVSFRVGSA